MVCGGWGFWAPMAGWDGSVIRVVVSRDVWDLWMLTVAGGGWMVSPGRLKENATASSLHRDGLTKVKTKWQMQLISTFWTKMLFLFQFNYILDIFPLGNLKKINNMTQKYNYLNYVNCFYTRPHSLRIGCKYTLVCLGSRAKQTGPISSAVSQT